MQKLREWNNKLQCFSRRSNLRLVGIKEDRDENVEICVKSILKGKFQMKDVIIERAHQVGPLRETNEP